MEDKYKGVVKEVSALLTENFATKQDLGKVEKELQDEIAGVEVKLREETAAVKEVVANAEAKLREEIAGVEGRLQQETAVIKAEIRGLRESTKADVKILAADIRGFREATEAEIRAQRESTDARLDAHGQVLNRIERQIERVDANRRATIQWIVGTVLTGVLVVAAISGVAVRFVQTGGG